MRSQVGIIFIGDIRFCPYLKQYTDQLKKANISYEVLFWQREETKEIYNEKHLVIYSKRSKFHKKPYQKVLDFWGYRCFLKKQIRLKKYSKLIILTTLSGLLIPDVLEQYKGRYWFDYRDVSYEHISVIRKLTFRLVWNAYATSISSKGFKEILPGKYDYIVSHNVKGLSIEEQEEIRNSQSSDCKEKTTRPIVLGYVGFVRNRVLIEKMMDAFSNDPRFILKFYGTGPDYEAVVQYLREKQYSNIVMYGYYDEKDKASLIRACDMINYYYPLTRVNKWALANRYYDGLLYKKPMWVCPDTYSGQLVMEQEVGIGISLDDPAICEKIYQYYTQLDKKAFNERVKELIKQVENEQEMYVNKVQAFCRCNV